MVDPSSAEKHLQKTVAMSNQMRRRGRGRGAPGPSRNQGPDIRSVSPALPVSALRQVAESEEVKLLRKFGSIGADRIRTEYGLTGLLSREVRIPSQRWGDEMEWVPIALAEDLLSKERRHSEAVALANRGVPRLNRLITVEDLGTLSQSDLRILRMSQKEWNSFIKHHELVLLPEGSPPEDDKGKNPLEEEPS